MQKCSYASEPFNLRLTVLRLLRDLKWILCGTLAGVLIFGGGYFLKNIVFGALPRYEKTITFQLTYTNPPTASGDYYINEMTWNTYVDSEMFRQLLEDTGSIDVTASYAVYNIAEALSATVASDIHVPAITVSTEDAGATEEIAGAVEAVLTESFVDYMEDIKEIRILDVSPVTKVMPDVRPLRAGILSAVLSFLFWIFFFLIREIGADSIWLPATLTERYGLTNIGTVKSIEFGANLGYVFQGRTRIAICPADAAIDPGEVIRQLPDCPDSQWEAMPSPMLCPQVYESLRQADGVLLVVRAGLHSGAPLEYLLTALKTQQVHVSACLLWEADEKLIRWYYFGNAKELD